MVVVYAFSTDRCEFYDSYILYYTDNVIYLPIDSITLNFSVSNDVLHLCLIQNSFNQQLTYVGNLIFENILCNGIQVSKTYV